MNQLTTRMHHIHKIVINHTIAISNVDLDRNLLVTDLRKLLLFVKWQSSSYTAII